MLAASGRVEPGRRGGRSGLSVDSPFPLGALHGFEERIYDKHGNLAGRKIKQDPSFLRAMLGAQDPENWGARGERDGNITVVIMDVAE